MRPLTCTLLQALLLAGLRHALIPVLALAAPLCGAAEESSLALQQRIKAAFLYKFAAYVEWPPSVFSQPETPIVIGVAGADAIAHELEQVVVGRKIAGRSVNVRRLARGESAGECCQILFIGSGERTRIAELLADAQGHPVLTVTDIEARHPKGSIINFLATEDRIRFDISRDAAERNGLQLSSQLLGVARQVASP
jgi:uncharacterized protein DUF4154